LSSACTAEDEDGGTEPSPQASSSSPTATVHPKKCLARQADQTYAIGGRLQNVTKGVLAEPDRVPPKALRRFVREVRQTVEEASKVCGDEATELDALAELVRTMTESGLDEGLLRQIVTAFEAWGRAIGRPRETRIVYAADPCVPLRKKVHATYEVLRRPESGGVAVSIDLVLVNNWNATVYLDHGGRIRATGVRPDGATRTFQWGGSSSDTAGARPGRTSTTRVSPIPPMGPEPAPILLLPDGDVHVFDVYGSAYASIGPCPIAVEPAR
jgi:hypothetical protein